MPAASPQPSGVAPSPSLHPSSANDLRPTPMKRQSSQSSNGYTRHNSRDVSSVGSQPGEVPLQQRHAVRPKAHARVVLPRNHSSGKNLAKMARQAPNGNARGPADVYKHARQRSHENDTEIRLPGSLDESVEVSKPPIRRNMTSAQLPRNASHTKLKKNYSHGQLSRLGSGKNLVALGMAAQRAPLSPGLKGKSRRPKSADFSKVEKDLHEQEAELLAQLQAKREGPKKVGFAVGSPEDASDAEDAPLQMEGSGLQEDEWTEESASASPYSTRQHTAENSRRSSVVLERPSAKVDMAGALASEVGKAMAAEVKAQQLGQEPEADGTPANSYEDEPRKNDADDDDDADDADEAVDDDGARNGDKDEDEDADRSDSDDPPSPRSQPRGLKEAARTEQRPAVQHHLQSHPAQNQLPSPPGQHQLPSRSAQQQRMVSESKDHPNPTTQFLRRKSAQLAAPARISNITALDDVHSKHDSPAISVESSRLTLAPDTEQDELVSRFIPSASHPDTSSGANTVMNTPRNSHFHTPEEDSTLASQNRATRHRQPISPGGSTVSGSSGAATPALGRSRTELKMLQEKAVAEMESAHHPIIPPHVYDRRNESLKSYLNLAALSGVHADGGNSISGLPMSSSVSLGPEIFQGRFKAVHTELRVVQKFRNPFAESIARLMKCKGAVGVARRLGRASSLRGNASPLKVQATTTAAALRGSKSAVSLPAVRQRPVGVARTPPTPSSSKMGTSVSPPKSSSSISPVKPALATGRSSVVLKGGQRRGVSFAGSPVAQDDTVGPADGGAEAIARRLWDSVLSGQHQLTD